MRKIVIGLAATVLVAGPLALAASANAATLNADGTGFVGKGEVQSAYGLNNSAIQQIITTNEQAFTFTSSQAATQAITSSATESATQSATQTAHRVLSCTVTQGGDKHPKVFVNDGTRDGVRTGTREGTRQGTRTGSLDGTLTASIDAKARKTGQWTGWNLNQFSSRPTFGATGAESFGAADFGAAEYNFGDYNFGDVEWSGWVAEQGEHPADCDRNDTANDGKEITDLVDVTTYGDVVPGTVEVTGTTYGPTIGGAVTGSGPAQVFVSLNGEAPKPLPLPAV